MHMTRTSSCLLGFAFLLSMPSLAHAYLDPGSGSIVLQAIIGGIAAGTFVIRGYIYSLAIKLGLAKPSSRGQKDPGE